MDLKNSIQEIECPRCRAEIEVDLPPGVIMLGKPRLKIVPVLIPAETARVAERLRILADQLERGDYDGPDAALVMLFNTQRKLLDVSNHINLNKDQVVSLLVASLESLGIRRQVMLSPTRRQ